MKEQGPNELLMSLTNMTCMYASLLVKTNQKLGLWKTTETHYRHKEAQIGVILISYSKYSLYSYSLYSYSYSKYSL